MEVGEPMVIERDGRLAGVVSAHPSEEAGIRQALAGSGYRVGVTDTGPDGALELGQECTEEKPRPCELEVVATRVEQLATEAGGATNAIQDLMDRQVTEEEVRQAVRQTIDSMPAGEIREEAELWYDAGFGG